MLCKLGITGKTHRWIDDFLGNSTLEVFANVSKSERRMVKSDEIQGTVLNPLLFLIYIMTLNLKSPVALEFLLMILPFTDQYIVKATPSHYKNI